MSVGEIIITILVTALLTLMFVWILIVAVYVAVELDLSFERYKNSAYAVGEIIVRRIKREDIKE